MAKPKILVDIKDIKEQLNNIMPFRIIKDGKTYKYGFQINNGKTQIIYEEII